MLILLRTNNKYSYNPLDYDSFVYFLINKVKKWIINREIMNEWISPITTTLLYQTWVWSENWSYNSYYFYFIIYNIGEIRKHYNEQ